jgi:hypothetical protein
MIYELIPYHRFFVLLQGGNFLIKEKKIDKKAKNGKKRKIRPLEITLLIVKSPYRQFFFKKLTRPYQGIVDEVDSEIFNF